MLNKTLYNRLKGAKNDRKGVAAIEFALIAPVMIAFYFGLAETTLAITKDRNVAHTASVAGDLATQVSELNKEGIEDVMTAALTVINVPAAEISKVTIELQSFMMSTDGSETVNRIGYARVGPLITASEMRTLHPSQLSKNMLNETSGAVVARIAYRYEPNTLKFVDNMVLSESFVLKPRKSLSVPFAEGAKINFICTAHTDMTVSC